MLKHLFIALLAALSLSGTLVQAAEVKQSSSGICHDTSSPYYERIKRYTSYNSIEECLRAGGRLSKASTPTKVHNSTSTNYSRSQFGHGWDDADGDCQNSRHEALIAQSTAPVRFKSGRKCQVSSGRWISPFTGSVIHDPRAIDIDHVVPLRWAWDHGADKWPRIKREHFANDPANLLSVEASLNRQKGARGLDQWLPPANQCQYVVRFLRVTMSYKLQLTSSEKAAYSRIRQRVCD